MRVLHIILILWHSGNIGFLIACLIIGTPIKYDWCVPASLVAIAVCCGALVIDFCGLIDCVEEETSKKKK